MEPPSSSSSFQYRSWARKVLVGMGILRGLSMCSDLSFYSPTTKDKHHRRELQQLAKAVHHYNDTLTTTNNTLVLPSSSSSNTSLNGHNNSKNLVFGSAEKETPEENVLVEEPMDTLEKKNNSSNSSSAVAPLLLLPEKVNGSNKNTTIAAVGPTQEKEETPEEMKRSPYSPLRKKTAQTSLPLKWRTQENQTQTHEALEEPPLPISSSLAEKARPFTAAVRNFTINSTNEQQRRRQQQRIAIYMTTHLSAQHIEFLQKCWRAAFQRLPLLQQADLLVYANHDNPNLHKYAHLFYDLGFANVKMYPYNKLNQYQKGAIVAMLDPFLAKNRWFQDYDWIIRLNPDVLIRRDQWLLETMNNPSIDGIFIDWSYNSATDQKALQTDFYAFRPQAVNVKNLFLMYQIQKRRFFHAEPHLYPGFQDIIERGRVAWLPNAERKGDWARVLGTKSDVVHVHDLVQECPNYFNVTDGKYY